MSSSSTVRCSRCGYLRRGRHPGPADTCPWCNAVYWKAAADATRREQRRKRKYYEDFLRNQCAKCGASFSILVSICPYCAEAKSRKHHIIASSLIASLVLGLIIVKQLDQQQLISPFPTIGDRHYQRCVQLSGDLLDPKNRSGDAMSVYYRLQSEWHGKCSRAALGSLNNGSAIPLPSTPEGWLQSVARF